MVATTIGIGMYVSSPLKLSFLVKSLLGTVSFKTSFVTHRKTVIDCSKHSWRFWIARRALVWNLEIQ